MTYYCPVCHEETDEPEEETWKWGDAVTIVHICPTCGSEIVESWDCPIHGTSAPDGYGNCAKC